MHYVIGLLGLRINSWDMRASQQVHIFVENGSSCSSSWSSMDILGLLRISSEGNRYLLMLKDVFSKWLEAIPLSGTTNEKVLRTGGLRSGPAAVELGTRILFLLSLRLRKTMFLPHHHQSRATPPPLRLPLPLTTRLPPSPATRIHKGRNGRLLQILLTPRRTEPPPRVPQTTRNGLLNLAFHPAPMRMRLPLCSRGDEGPPAQTTLGNTGLARQTDMGTRNANFGTASSPSWDGDLSSPF